MSKLDIYNIEIIQIDFTFLGKNVATSIKDVAHV